MLQASNNSSNINMAIILSGRFTHIMSHRPVLRAQQFSILVFLKLLFGAKKLVFFFYYHEVLKILNAFTIPII